VARSLGPFGLGIFSVAWTVASMLSFFAPLGIDTWLIRELNRGRGRHEIRSMLGLSASLGLAFGAGLAGIAIVVVDTELARAVAAAALFVGVSPAVLVLRACFHGRERMELETATTALEGAVGLAAVAVVLLTSGGVSGAMLGLGFGRLANLALSTVLARRLWGRITPRVGPRAWIAVLQASLPMGIAYMFTTLLLRFDIVLLGLMRPATETGMYSAAAVVVLAVPVVATSLVGSLYPALSRSGRSTDPALGRIFRTAAAPLFGTGLCAAATLSVLAGAIVHLAFGSRFADAASMLSVLAWVLPVRFLNVLCGTTLNATDRQGRRAVAVGVGALVNLGANLVLIPVYGAWGAVWSSLLTEVGLLTLMLWGLDPLRPPALRPLLQGGAIALAMAGAVLVVPGPLPLRASIALVVFAPPALVAWGRPLRELASATT
jgi:O-antigen/teichoic acid export membrane protein